jgi:hypothetical protein
MKLLIVGLVLIIAALIYLAPAVDDSGQKSSVPRTITAANYIELWLSNSLT